MDMGLFRVEMSTMLYNSCNELDRGAFPGLIYTFAQ